MTILALFLFMIVFTVAGFAVDLMRYDRERVKLQYALDRAVLAAADLDQDLCPRDVVVDYLAKENLDQYLVGEITVEPDTCGASNARLEGKRLVRASAEMEIGTHFMQWSGVDTLGSRATSVAEESIGNVEISLVLDVSGSMRGTKLTNLKTAANDFIDEMTEKSEDGKLSISIIPYSEQVSIPSFLMNELNTIGANERANCVDFAASDFITMDFDAYDITDPDTGTIIRRGSDINQTLHFRDNGSRDYRYSDNLVSSNTCRRETSTDQREMAVMQKNAETLKNKITNMQASGWTSIDVGLKWGLTLLDDSIQPLVAQMQNNGAPIPSEFGVRPGRNRTSDTLKVLVLMTDGENTYQHKVNPPYNNDDSMIHWNAGEGSYSVYDEDRLRWAWPNVDITVRLDDGTRWTRDKYQSIPHDLGETYTRYRCTSYYDNRCHSVDRSRTLEVPVGGTTLEQLKWPDVWAHTEKSAIYNLLNHTFGYTYAEDWWAVSSTEIGPSTKNPRVASLCAQAEQQEILIFSIAFEAPSGVKQLLKDCAVKDGRYYEATGTQIVGVFDSISATIQNLRLTQ
ncbi:pilus assembly protein TadG-related protein [Ruegeria sp.]|uniref:Tad domain-containing protein n=1 Tax=Ruegeria sp. TaxID=1879320 RepID=UPI003C7A3547